MTDSLRNQVEAAFDKDQEISQEEQVEDVQSDEEPETGHLPNDSTESEEPEQATVEDEINAPEHWGIDDKEMFKALDNRGRDFLLRRHKQMEADYTKNKQALAEEQKIAESFKKAVTPYESYLKEIGLNPQEAFEKLLATEMRLRMVSPKEKAQILQNLAQEYGAEFDPNAEPIQIDEATQRIYDELNRQKSELMQLKQEREFTQKRSIDSTIESFANQKDDKGILKHPHFETLRDQMGKLLNSGLAGNLDEAYERAIYLQSDLRDEYISRHTNKDKQEADTRQKTLASKRAGFNVKSGASSQITDPKEKLNLRQQLERDVGAYFSH